MARDYGTRRTARPKNNPPNQFLVVVVTFLLGYLTASIFDMQTISHWMNTQVLASHDKPEPVKKVAQNPAVPPKPKFEFYTLLANDKGNTAGQAAKTTTTTQATPTTTAAQTTVATTSPTDKPVAPQQAVAAAVKVAEGRALAPAKAKQGAFLVQVASFKARKDAEQMKGTLILKGFDVSVVPVTNTQGNWFRVVIGPYANRNLAQQAQGNIARTEHLKGMVTPVRG